MNILITGIAGDIGRSIASILKNERAYWNIVGTDIDCNFPNNMYCNLFYKGLPITNESYLYFIEGIVKKESIDLIIPTSEIEIRYFNKHKINFIAETPILLASNVIMDIGFDKLETISFLERNNFPYPKTKLLKDFKNDFHLPAIVKSRSGAGSKQLFIATENNLEMLIKEYPEWIIQQQIFPKDEEYTCCIFKAKDQRVSTITLKRVLKSGRTGFAEVVDNPHIEQLLLTIADNLDFNGSINVQLILMGETPVVFEINPRFSSTVKFRDMLGFQDVIWSISDLLDKDFEMDYDKQAIIGKKLFRADAEIVY